MQTMSQQKNPSTWGQDQHGLPEEGVLQTVGNKVDNAQASVICWLGYPLMF